MPNPTNKKGDRYICSKCKRYFSSKNLIARGAGKIKTYFVCLGCNRDAMRKYVKTKKGRKNMNEAVYRSMRKYPEKQRARSILNRAVKLGKIKRPSKCKCGKYPVQGHHPDYLKPLKVKWLCRECHRLLHRKEKK